MIQRHGLVVTVIPVALVAAGLTPVVDVRAQTVEMRIVERRGQNHWFTSSPLTVPGNDNVLDFAVQARVVSGTPGLGIGLFSFNISTTSSESESRGTLERAIISNTDGTYVTGPTQYGPNATVGRGGLAAMYSYLAGLTGDLNGVINTSNGTYTNNPLEQDIGKVTGGPLGAPMLLLADPNGTGNPATYPGTGTTAPLDANLANLYLGGNGNFVDLYHFRYVISAGSPDRILSFGLNGASAQVFSTFGRSDGLWGPIDAITVPTSVGSGVSFFVGIPPSPGTAATFALACACTVRRRRK